MIWAGAAKRLGENIGTPKACLRGALQHTVVPYYRKTFNIRRTLVCNKIVDHSDVVGASPVGAAPTTSSFST